jgi:hypothetical protein
VRRVRSVAVILEWETALECGGSRGTAVLQALSPQFNALCRDGRVSAQTVVCFDRHETDEATIRRSIDAALAGDAWPGALLVVSSPDRLDYYQKKNFGFGYTAAEIVIFLDSDVIPEPEWLGAMLDAFDDPRKAVVMGRTHMDTDTRFARAVALSWIFNARSEAPPRRASSLISNNIAFRRQLFARMPFPDRPTYRGQCTELGRKLMRAGVAMYELPSARGAHPAHSGLGAMIAKAVHAGRDLHYYDRINGTASGIKAIRQWRHDLANVGRRIAERRQVIGASPPDVVLAKVLGEVYYIVKCVTYLWQTAIHTVRISPQRSTNARGQK